MSDSQRNISSPDPEEASNGKTSRRWFRLPVWRRGSAANEPGSTPSRLARFFRTIGYLILGAGSAILLLLLLLQTGWGANRVRLIAEGRINGALANATIQIGRLDGNMITHAELIDVLIIQADGTVLIEADTISAQYRLLPLLFGRLHVKDLSIIRPAVTMHQRPDSTWDLLTLFPSQAIDAQQSDAGTMSIEMERFRLLDGTVAASFYAAGRDSTFRMQDAELRLSRFYLGDDLTFVIDTLSARFEAPVTSGDVEFALGGAVSSKRLEITGLRLESEHSHVYGTGSVAIPSFSEAKDLGSAPTQRTPSRFTLTAQPLSFADISAFVPGLNPSATVDAEIFLEEVDSSVTARGRMAFSGGGIVDLSANLTLPGSESVQYAVEAQVTQINIGDLFTADFFSGSSPTQLDAKLIVDLQGASLDQLNGSVDLTLTGIPPGLEQLGPTTASGRFNAGLLDLNLSTSWEQLRLMASGTLRPFDAVPSYDLAIDLMDFDAGAFLDARQPTTDLDASIGIRGEGVSPGSTNAHFSVAILPSTINRLAILAGSLEGSLADGRLTLDASLETQPGSVAVTAEATLGEELAFTISDGRVVELDVAAMAGDSTTSSVTGTLQMNGSGSTIPDLRLMADLAISGGSYGSFSLPVVDLTARLRNERLTLSADSGFEAGGSLSLNGTLNPFADEMSFEITQGAFTGIDVGRMGLVEGLQTELNGAWSARGRGTTPASLHLEGRIDLAPSLINQQAVSNGVVAVNLDRGALDFALDVASPSGTVRMNGHARPFDDTPVVSIESGSFADLDIGPFVNRESVQSQLTGTFGADVQGAEPEDMRFSAHIDLAASLINREAIQDGYLTFLQEKGESSLDVDLQLATGAIRIQGAGRLLDEVPSYSLEGSLDGLNLASAAGIDSTESAISLAFGLEGTGNDPGSMRLAAFLHSAGSFYGPIRVDTVDVRVDMSEGVLRASNVLVQSNVVNTAGSGTVALFDTTRTKISQFLLRSTIVDLEPVRSLMGLGALYVQSGQFITIVGGTSDQLKLDVGVNTTALVYENVHVSELDGRVTGLLDADWKLGLTTANLTIEYLSMPTFEMELATLEGEYNDDLLTYSGDIRFDQRRSGTFSGALERSGDAGELTIDAADFKIEKDEWTLRSPATLRYGDRYIFGNTVLASGSQQLVLAGVIDPEGQQNAYVRATNVDVAPFAAWFGLDRLGGTLNTSLILSGAASQPRLAGSLGFDILSSGRPVGDVRMSLLYDSLRVKVDATIEDRGGSKATVLGYVPIDLRLDVSDDTRRTVGEEIGFHIDVSAASIAWMQPFIDRDIADVRSGMLTADMDITGTLEAPVLGGSLQLDNASIRLPQFGLTYERISFQSTLENNQILVSAAEVHSGEGTMEARGSIDFTTLMNSTFNLNLVLNTFRAIQNDEYQATVSGDMVLSGRTTEPRLEGRMRLMNTDIFLTEYAGGDLEQVSLTMDDERMLEDVFGYRVNAADTTAIDFYRAMELSLDVTMERDTWIRQRANPEMAIELAGRVDISKNAHSDDLLLFRSIDVIPERSFIKQFGRRFKITAGTVSFNGPLTEMVMDIGARYEVLSRLNPGEPEATITLALSGRIDDLRFELGSDPTMDNTDIVSYIATGRPASQSLQFGGANQTDGLLGLAAGQLAGVVEGVAGENLGLDVIEIQQDGLRGTQLTAGKYLSGRTYVGISQPISFGGQSSTQASESREVAVEYKVFEWLLLQILGDTSTSAVHLNLTGRYSF